MLSESLGEFQQFENMIAEKMAEAHIPGLSVALIKNDQIVYARGFGARNLENNTPATPNTLYGVGSITKSLTALAIMQLVEAGKIDLQDAVSKFLPISLGNKEVITIHHLLSHSSGIPDLGIATTVFGRLEGDSETWIPMGNFDDLFLHVNGASKELAAEPGKRFFYLNEGYALLGEIIERVSKMKYDEYIKERILKPLEMDRSTFLKEDFLRDPDVMTPYILKSKDETIKAVATGHPFHRLVYALGGLLSSVIELSNYLVANMYDGVFQSVRILDGCLLEEMHKIHVEKPRGLRYYGDFGREGYGYGWMISENFLGHKLVDHGGDTGVSSAQFSFVPELKIGVVAAANRGASTYPPVCPEPVLLGALALLMGKDPMKEIPFFEIENRLKMLVGEYEKYKGTGRLTIVQKEGLLYLDSKETDIIVPLIPENDKVEDYKFYTIPVPGGKFPVEFEVSSSGEIDLYIERNRFHKIVPLRK